MAYENSNFITMQNTTLSRLMYVDIIRDEIMDQVAPMDVVNFMIGTRIRFSKEDMERYKSIFKYIIPNRRWLQTKLTQDYAFTIVGTDLKMLRDPIGNEVGSRFWNNSMTLPTFKSKHMYLIMIVTKDKSTISCTDEFLDGSGILPRSGCGRWPATYRMTKDDSIAPMTSFPVNIMNVPIVLSCTTDMIPVDKCLWLDPSLSAYGYMCGGRPLDQVQHATLTMNREECIFTTDFLMSHSDTIEELNESPDKLLIAFKNSYPGLGISHGTVVAL